MKRFFGIALIMIIFAGMAQANTLSADAIKKDVHTIILKDLSSKTTANVDIKILMLPFQNLNLPDGHVSYQLINNSGDFNLLSRDVRRINILVDGKIQRTISVPIEIKAYEDVLVASENISREQPVNLTKVITRRINIADKSNFIVTKDMLRKEMIAKRDFINGEMIDKRFLKSKPDVIKNNEVRIILDDNNGLQVSVDGIAKNDGSIGEYITVENKTYNKTYTAKVIGENKVLVQI